MSRSISLLAAAMLLAGCSKNEQPDSTASLAEPPPAEGNSSQTPPPPTFQAVDQALEKGSFDDAAARLLEMRTVRQDFTPQEAAEYRRKLNEAYSAALDAADKGDPRAKAALEMIRANPPR